MKCPRCSSELDEVSKGAVVVDLCAGCGGIWLDKGELAKIVSQMKEAEAALNNELGVTAPGERRPAESRPQYREDDRYRENHYDQNRDKHHVDHDDRHDRYDRDDHKYPRRKKSAFQNLFDIFD